MTVNNCVNVEVKVMAFSYLDRLRKTAENFTDDDVPAGTGSKHSWYGSQK
jgi:hypothetical protein